MLNSACKLPESASPKKGKHVLDVGPCFSIRRGYEMSFAIKGFLLDYYRHVEDIPQQIGVCSYSNKEWLGNSFFSWGLPLCI
jgi:hypothetical protein